MNPVIQSYSAGYEQAKRDIKIEEEKTVRIKSEQLDEQICQELSEQFRGAVAPEDDMMELMGMKQEEHESLQDFVKRYHRVVLDLGTFNHPQALKGLKEGVRIGRLWYNLRNLVIQSYSAGYKQAKRDIEIEYEKTARIKSEQLEELRQKEKRILTGSGLGKQAGELSIIGGASA